ncbi:winged helix-turn-helix domain-containing protein [Spelaeicoccus albus]|uniref:DNA-binding MarR family transcriptional regulator n=1 Tax=Spelaeicoccus albus TaxID=1280376 RepID=A0A7Z0D3G4_9MICO|nr:helix-turn-helix domain-containing protein [Spelaeicoccus albus]NYI68173.1 DNA-binding MarR family transcriptional regulator [Spelaeicoccus albus]
MTASESSDVREIGPAELKGLAHPLRMAIYDSLSMYGPQTATGLAKQLGESSGSTSYHLRQLARHQFIRVAEGKGNGREKWWERTPGAVAVGTRSGKADPSATAAANFVLREWTRGSQQALADFVDGLFDQTRVPPSWSDVSDISTSNLRLTREQLAEVVAEYHAVTQKFIDRFRNRDDPGSRPVQIQFNAFPLIDGEETPS